MLSMQKYRKLIIRNLENLFDMCGIKYFLVYFLINGVEVRLSVCL